METNGEHREESARAQRREALALGPYRLVKRLAVGGMAEIFLARREGPEGFARELVVKRILPHLSADAGFVGMFLGEARLAAQLHHPNVVHVYDFGEADESYYLAMELVRGVDLRALIDRAVVMAERRGGGCVPPHHAAKIVSYVCEGLAHAHALELEGGGDGIVHRDVTPSNVLLSFDGAVKLADFGIAKVHEGLSRRDVTRHGVVKGKYAYLSPEQARGDRVDARSDLFNVGILLFEALVGEPLFPQDDRAKAKWLAARGQVPGLDRLASVPPPLAAVVRRALSPEPQDRYPDALELRADLEAYLRSQPEPSGTVELGRYVRELFPDVVSDDEPRAAGTVPATSAITAIGPPTELPEPDAPSTSTAPVVAKIRAARPRRGAWILGAIAAVVAVLGAGLAALALWPEGPPAVPPTELPVEAPVVASPSVGQLRVRTEPPGAQVLVDGVVRGAAPVVLDVTAGRRHVVEVRSEGDVVSGREEVVLGEDEVREVVFSAVEPLRARVRILSSPGGATVRLGDRVLGVTPLEAYVSPGRHTVRVRLDGFAEAEDDIEIAGPEETATLSFALTPQDTPRAPSRGTTRPRGSGQLTIATTPWSEVYLGSRHLGTTPLANVRLPAGRHVLSLRHPGRPTRRVPVRIEAGETTRVRMPL